MLLLLRKWNNTDKTRLLNLVLSMGLAPFLLRVEHFLDCVNFAPTLSGLANHRIQSKLYLLLKILRLDTENKILRRLTLKENTLSGAADMLYRQNFQYQNFQQLYG